MSYEPRQISHLDVFGLFLLLLAQSFLGLAVHVGNDNLFSLLAHSCSAILCSQFLYSAVTSFQYIKHLVLQFFSWRSTKKKVPASSGVSISALLFSSDHFAPSDGDHGVRMSRGNLWRLQYPVAIGFFSFFACTPVFDATCTCSLVAGFLIRSSHEELVRGSHFHRPISRRVLFFVVSFFGFLSCCVIFAFAYSIGVVATDSGMQKSHDFRVARDSEIYAEMAHLGRNDSSTVLIADENQPGAYNDTQIFEDFLVRSQITNKSVIQYVRWTAKSYATKMFLLWVTFFLAPFMVNSAPRNMDRAMVVEFAHAPVSLVATSVMCMISLVISREPFVLLNTANAGSVAYMLVSPVLTWLIIWKLLHHQKKKTLYVPTGVFLLVTFIKHCVQHRKLLQVEIFDEIAICSGVMVFLYVIVLFVFMRLEMTAIRSGWGASGSRMLRRNELELGDAGDDLADDEDASFVIEETVQEVLDNAKRDLEMVESALHDVSQEESTEREDK